MGITYARYKLESDEEVKLVYFSDQEKGFYQLKGKDGSLKQGEIQHFKKRGLTDILDAFDLLTETIQTPIIDQEIRELETSDAGFDRLFKTPNGYDIQQIMINVASMKYKRERVQVPISNTRVGSDQFYVPIDEGLVKKIGSEKAGACYSRAEENSTYG